MATIVESVKAKETRICFVKSIVKVNDKGSKYYLSNLLYEQTVIHILSIIFEISFF